MILQRLRRHLEEQNWFAVIIEMLIVIMGVTLAYQINVWNENRKDRSTEESILRGLENEFELAESEILGDIRNRRVLIQNQEVIEELRAGNAELGVDSVKAIVDRLVQYRFYTPTHPILQEIQSTGLFDLIKSEKLRRILTKYLQEKDRLYVTEERERYAAANRMEPYLSKKIDLLTLYSKDSVGIRSEVQQFHKMLHDHEFGSILFLKTDETRSALRYSEIVLSIIKQVQEALKE